MENSDSGRVRGAVSAILSELIEGSSGNGGWVLNPHDVGLLSSLDRVSAEDASRVAPHATSSIASHVDHLRYGLSLLNRSSTGENPFGDADWEESWRTVRVSEADWERLRADLSEEARTWLRNSEGLAQAGEIELTGVLASAAHLAYHLGAIRQISPAARGPRAGD